MLSFETLSKTYADGTQALSAVTIDVAAGEILALVGGSGCGKTTLLRLIAGLDRPSAGRILLNGEAIIEPRADVGVIFQEPRLFPWLSVAENIGFGLSHLSTFEREGLVTNALVRVGLAGHDGRWPRELSGGQQQRVAIARALVTRPKLLLMDEPFSALDVLTAETLRTDLLDLWAEGRMPIKSILIVTHNIEEAVLMCDRILVFSSNPGRVAAEIKVDLPQPRDRLDPAFRKLVDDIYAQMTARALAEPVRDGLFPGTGIQMVLPRVSTNALAGLIEEVDASPFDGRAAMADLADQLQLEVDDLFPMAETLQLLRFAELQGADILLTPAARRYAQADVDARKALFAQALLAHVPLAQHIRRILDERSGHVAPARRFRDELEDHMSGDYADETLRTVTHWGRYAEVFAYDEDADRFSLDDVV